MTHSFFAAAQFFYLDPGSGSFIIQMLIAGALGAGLAVRIYWRKIKSLFVKEPPQTGENVEPTEDMHGQNQ